MAKKASSEKTKPNPGIQINRSRGGGKKKPDLFARLRNDEHPLDNIFPVELDFQPLDRPDNQTSEILDAQVEKTRTPKTNKAGRPTNPATDVQYDKSQASKSESTGRPTEQNLDAWTSKSPIRTSKSHTDLDVKTPKKLNLDVQHSTNKEKRRVWENNRATDRVSLRPNRDILRKFKVFCAKKDLGLTEFFEISGLKFIELDAQAQADLDVLTPIDDRRLKILFKTKAFIINLYLRYNSVFNELAGAGGNKKWSARWTPRDDEAAVRYNDLPPAVVELGILQTQIQKGFGTSRIQTFRYYTDEIEKVLASGVSDEMLETILTYHRNIWKNQTGREVDLKFLEEKA